MYKIIGHSNFHPKSLNNGTLRLWPCKGGWYLVYNIHPLANPASRSKMKCHIKPYKCLKNIRFHERKPKSTLMDHGIPIFTFLTQPGEVGQSTAFAFGVQYI